MADGLETPANKIATAQAVLSLTFGLSSEVNSERIGAELFTHEVTVFTGGTGLLLRASPERTLADLKAGMENLNVLALSASALTVDETLDEVFGKLVNDKDANRVAIRVMVN